MTNAFIQVIDCSWQILTLEERKMKRRLQAARERRARRQQEVEESKNEEPK